MSEQPQSKAVAAAATAAQQKINLNADYQIPHKSLNDLKAKYLVNEKSVGKGAFGEVFSARLKADPSQLRAIKVILKAKIRDPNAIKQLTRELSIHSQLDHPNIVKFYEAMDTDEAVYIVMEYVPNGDLFKKVTTSPLRRLEEKESRRYFQHLMEAMRFMHRNGIAHRDVKLENMLLGDGDIVKIADFGFSKALSQGNLVTSVGTPEYVSCEVVRTLSSSRNTHVPTLAYDLNADLWSCGVVLYAMMAGHYPFKDKDISKMYGLILQHRYVMSRHCTEGAARIIAHLLVDPKDRWSIDQIYADAWFQVDFDDNRKPLAPAAPGAAAAQ
jgi:5'-AMP-activated protein kinase catalytic alpha subunit